MFSGGGSRLPRPAEPPGSNIPDGLQPDAPNAGPTIRRTMSVGPTMTEMSKRSTPSVRRVVAYSCALACILVALIPAVSNGEPAFPDEGLYTAQADALAAGSWEKARAAPDMDDDGRWTALSDATIVNDSEIPYARRPFYPLLITPFWAVGGMSGVLVASIVGTWMAATFGALITRMMKPTACIPALWLIGLGTPLFFDAFLAVGHSLVAGFGAFTAYSALVCTESGAGTAKSHDLRWGAVAVASVVPLTLLRTEGAIIASSLGMAFVCVAFSISNRRLRISAGRFTLGGALIGAAAATYLINIVWGRSITALEQGDLNVGSRHPNLLNSLWSSIFKPWFGGAQSVSSAAVLVLASAILAPVALRLAPRARLLGLGILVLGAGAATVRAISAPNLISGLLPTAPWLILGLLSLRKADFTAVESRVLAVTSLVATAIILATSYGGGGAAEWGGRFFHAVLPVIGPLAAVGLASLCAALPVPDRRVAIGAVSIMVAGMSVAAGRTIRVLHDETDYLRRAVVEAAQVSGSDLVAYAMVNRDGSSRKLWQLEKDGISLLASPGLPGFKWIPDSLPAERDQITFLTDYPSKDFLEYLVSKTSHSRWTIERMEELPSSGLYAVSLRRT